MDDSCCQPIDFPGRDKFIAAVDAAVSAGDKHAVTSALRNALCSLIRDTEVQLPCCVQEAIVDHYARRELYRSPEFGYSVVATGDFNGDGRVDLVWTHSEHRDLYMWQGNGSTFTSTRFGEYPAGWQVVGAVDVDNDGRSDLLFHNPITRQFSYRILNGTSLIRDYLVGGVGPGYRVAALGDFNGDGFGDVVWTHPENLDLYMWVGNGNTFTSSLFGSYPAGWLVSGAADVDGDGRSDLLFHNAARREFSYRIMNGLSVTRAYLVGNVGPGYTIATVGDFNGDGLGDIVWTNPNNLDLYMWVGNGDTFTSTPFGSYPGGWGVIK